MAATKQKIITVGIDGGDFDPDMEPKSGISRLVHSFMKTVSKSTHADIGWNYYSFSSSLNLKRQKNYASIRLPSRFFSSLFLPVKMLVDRVDICLAFSGVLPGLVRLFGKKSIVFIHDFGFYDNPQNYFNAPKMIWQTEYALYGADRIVVFSDYIKRELFRRFPAIPPAKVTRIYPGADHLILKKNAQTPRTRYFLYVGVIKPAKNIETLLSRFFTFLKESPDKKIKLILVGQKEKAYFEKLKNTALYIQLKDNLLFKDHATEVELAGLYASCIALLNVSHDEGFCYPVAEALRLGSTVILNDIPLYHEFAGRFANVNIAKQPEDFITYMRFAAKGKKNTFSKMTKEFTWSNFSQEIINIINSLSK